MSATAGIIADRRKKVLDALAQMSDGQLSETVILMAVQATGRDSDHDTMRADLKYLEFHNCVTIEKLALDNGDLWRVKLTNTGLLASRGQKVIPQVHRRTTA